MSGTPPSAPAEDTISLIDLLVVVVRFRYWILGLTLAGLVGAFGFLGLKTFVAHESLTPDPVYKAQVTIALSASPGLLGEYLDKGIADQAVVAFQTLGLVAPVFRASVVDGNKVFGDRGFERMGTLEYYLQDQVLGKAFVVTRDGATSTLRVSFEDRDASRAKEFVTALTERVRSTIRIQVLKQISLSRKSLQQALETMESGSGSTQDRVLVTAELSQKLQLLDLLTNDDTFPLVPLAGVAVLELPPGKGIVGKEFSPSLLVVITTAASFLASLVFAFFLEYLRRLRNEPFEMNKLRDAFTKERR